MFNILLVDDDADVRRVVKKILEKSGYAVVAVDNGLSALSELNENSYDLLLSDASMPQYSGFDLLKAVRRLPKHNDLVIAMLTGRREKDDIQKAVELGANDYIVKPVQPEVLVGKIEKLLGGKSISAAVTQFPDSVPVNFEASFQTPIQILKIGLGGFSGVSPYPMVIGQDFYLNIDSLDYDVLPKARITANIIDTNTAKYIVHGVFLEADETFKNEIRKCIKKSRVA